MAFYPCFMKTTLNSMFQTFIILIFSTQAFLSEFNNGRLVYYLALVGLFLWYIMCISFTLAIMNPTLLKCDFDNYCFYILPHVLQRIFYFLRVNYCTWPQPYYSLLPSSESILSSKFDALVYLTKTIQSFKLMREPGQSVQLFQHESLK